MNHPVGLLQQIHKVLRPGGVLVLTTPNPSTLVNALRVLLDRHSLWGTEDFACLPKIVEGKIIDKGEIHYREYRASELRTFLTLAGFDISFSGYIGSGLASHHSVGKRFAKSLIYATGLDRSRLFATSDYVIASKK